ncbi:uncharacterized protein LOC125505058 isoform X1 [Dendroctonus ponderosae]|uniref:uncharacterized protein LOC109539214 isoform X1 n=2 Tax=Dendroctonus ponderosae TaxID=77166 RepID=UPI00203523C8|nr:uncharacterized protein LOC109539214 isoform X1 [Dendroctonus ponderosae]XP_048523953.1 uncharacterized protein LOC125505058 isoform X1 [Dendroctonus ponderosae]KAH0998495.1 hypothetical protein HUJ05_008590 [Dendroctonus ponderosae]
MRYFVLSIAWYPATTSLNLMRTMENILTSVAKKGIEKMVFYFEIDEEHLQKASVSFQEIQDLLPNWDTKITQLYKYENKGFYEVVLLINAQSEAEVKEWLEQYEERSKCSYTVASTRKTTGMKVGFKQFLRCRHNTNYKKGSGDSKRLSRNTNCESRMIVTLRTATRKKYRGKPVNAPDRQYPCEIRLLPCHNHPIGSDEVLGCRPVSKATKQKLANLFDYGHTPSTAMACLKLELQSSRDDYEHALKDRSICPKYQDTLQLFNSRSRGKSETTRELMLGKIREFNEQSPNSAAIEFVGDEYAICLCPPLMKRAHQKSTVASDMVFVDSTETSTHHASKVHVLSTTFECGALPLGVLITSTEGLDLITLAYRMLMELVGESIFGGNPEGPQLFMTDDSAAVQTALQITWQKSSVLLCNAHLLQSWWRWLIKADNAIRQDDQPLLFHDFRDILYARTNCECSTMYELALSRAAQYGNYCVRLRNYWQIKEQWALCFRPQLANGSNPKIDSSVRIIKDRIFGLMKKFNSIQMLDFVYNNFTQYYQKRLLDASTNRPIQNVLSPETTLIPGDILHNIKTLSEDIYWVPSTKNSEVFHVVNGEALDCTCIYKRSLEMLCKHIEWICLYTKPERFHVEISNMELRAKFYIAEGKYPRQQQLFPERSQSSDNCSTEVITVLVEDEIKDEGDSCNARTNDVIIEEGTEIVKNICTQLTRYLRESPNPALVALKTLESQLQGEFQPLCHKLSNDKTL